MPLPAVAIAAIVVVGQYAGIIGQVGSAITGIDNAINATIGLHKTIGTAHANNSTGNILREARRTDRDHVAGKLPGRVKPVVGLRNGTPSGHQETLARVER